MIDSSDLEKKINAIASCNTIEDIFSNSDFRWSSDFSAIIEYCKDNLLEEYILIMLSKGYYKLIMKNINCFDIQGRCDLSSTKKKFQESFIENFYNFLVSRDESKDEIIKKIKFGASEKESIIDNLGELSEKTKDNIVSRIGLLGALKEYENKDEIINDEAENLFYGNFLYSYYIPILLNNHLMNKEQIANLIIKNPTRVLIETINNNDDCINVLEQINEILESSSSLTLEDKENAKEELEKCISEHFSEILSGVKDSNKYKIKDLKKLKKWNTNKKIIDEKLKENFELISKNFSDEEIIDFLHLYSDIDVKLEKPDINTIIKNTYPELDDEYLQYSISYIVKELLDAQDLDISQMEILGQGYYSKCIKIGDYVFKIGKERRFAKIPYHENIAQPLIRQPLIGENGINAFLEIQCLGDSEWYKGLSNEEIEDELYKIYSDLREKGIRWLDVRKENVARLKKPNIDIFNIAGQVLKPDNKVLGIKNNGDKKVLPEGELVIIDTDYMQDFDDDIMYFSRVSLDKILEERYVEEHMSITLDDIKGAVEQFHGFSIENNR